MCEKYPQVQRGSKIYDTCRKKLAKLSEFSTLDLEPDLSPLTQSDSSDSEVIEEEECDSLYLLISVWKIWMRHLSPNGNYEPRNTQKGNLKV